jgi:hypothetical protein
VESDGAGDLAVVVGKLDGEVHVELGELSNACLAVKLLGVVCMCMCVRKSASTCECGMKIKHYAMSDEHTVALWNTQL